jgi:hypothetical protein
MIAAGRASVAGGGRMGGTKVVFKIIFAFAALWVAAIAAPAFAQAKNNVPDLVPGARPDSVERIKVHGASLEGNLEGDAADRRAMPPTKRAVIQ